MLPIVMDIVTNYPTTGGQSNLNPSYHYLPPDYGIMARQVEALGEQIEDALGFEVIRFGGFVAPGMPSPNIARMRFQSDLNASSYLVMSDGWAEIVHSQAGLPQVWDFDTPPEQARNSHGGVSSIPFHVMSMFGFKKCDSNGANVGLDGTNNGICMAHPHAPQALRLHLYAAVEYDDTLFLSAEDLKRVYCVFRDWRR